MSFQSFPASDGTLLAAHRAGKGEMPVVLANGLGGTFVAWHPILSHFTDVCRFYSWDYRGLYRSEAPADRGSLTVECAVDDQLALMEHFELDQVLLGGWSMGVQVALEFYRRHPERVKGFILLNGTYGQLFSTAFKSRLSTHFLPPAIRVLQQIAPFTGAVIKSFADWPYTVPLASLLGLVDSRLDRSTFRDVAREFGHLDLDLYFESLLRLSEHDASDVLPNVEVPTLIVAGERDLMTPPEVTSKMLREMPRAELFVVPRGSHYCLLEYPDLVARRVERFFSEHFSAAASEDESAGRAAAGED